MGKPGAAFECPYSNGGKAVREGEVGKPGAALECAVANGGKAVREGDGGKPGAAFECVCFNIGKAVRKSDGGKAGAALECKVANGGNPLRNGDVSDRVLVWPHHVLGDDFRIFGEGQVGVVDYYLWHVDFFFIAIFHFTLIIHLSQLLIFLCSFVTNFWHATPVLSF